MNKLHSYKFKQSALLVAVSLASIGPGSAPLVSAAVTLEEVVVTARKREESLQDTPISVAAFSGEELQARSLGDVSQIDQFTPNLTFDATAPISGSSNAASVFIRGVGQTDFVFTSDPGVGIYLDGIYIARSTGGVLDSMDVERVEVLRGPQGTLFGKNTIGGAVSVTTAKPDDEFRGEVELTTGRFDRRDARGFVNLPLSDNLFSRVSFSTKKRDGYAERVLTGQELGGEEKLAARASLRWEASDSLTVDFAADWSKANEDSPASTIVNNDPSAVGSLATGLAGQTYNALIGGGASLAFPFLPGLPAGTTPYDSRWLSGDLTKSFATGPTGSEYEIKGAAMTINWDLNDNLTIKSITGYRDLESDFGRDPDGSPLELVHTYNSMEHDQFSQEIQFLGNALDGNLEWVAGLYYMQEEGSDEVTVPFVQETFNIYAANGIGCNLSAIGGPDLTALGICPNFIRVDAQNGGTKIDNTSKAVFFEATYALSDAMSLTVGGRYTEDEKEVDLSGYLIGGLPGIATPVADDTFDNTSGRVILDYQWNDAVMTYISYSQGFKSGGYNPRYGLPLAAPTSFEPEEVDSWEIGAKVDFLEGRARLNVALFDADYTDIQVVVFDLGIPRTINAAEGTITGAELELTLLPVEALMLQFSYGYLDAEYSKLDDAVIGSFGTPIVNPLQKNFAFVNSPEHSFSFSAEYTMAVGDWGAAALRADVSYRDEIANDAINTPELIEDSLTLVNARVQIEPNEGNWSIALFGTNLGDEEYITSGVADKPSFGLVEVNVAPPRQWGASFTYKF